MYLLEIDPDVVFFRGQYPQLKYTLDGKPHTYTPDVLIQRKSKDREQVVEVKPASKVSSEKNASLFQVVAPIYRELGYEFLVITDELIQLQPRLNNIKLLHRYSRVPFTLQNFISCKKYFEDKGTTIIQRAVEDFVSLEIAKSQDDARRILYRSLYFGFLETDLMKPLKSDSSISLSRTRLDPAELRIV